jgi:hypothetical protein
MPLPRRTGHVPLFTEAIVSVNETAPENVGPNGSWAAAPVSTRLGRFLK